MNVHRDTQAPFHEQGWSPVTVALSLVSLTAAFLLRETFHLELERCVILSSALQAALGAQCLPLTSLCHLGLLRTLRTCPWDTLGQGTDPLGEFRSRI